MINKVNVLTKESVKEYKKIKDHCNVFENGIFARIDYIIRCIRDCFDFGEFQYSWCVKGESQYRPDNIWKIIGNHFSFGGSYISFEDIVITNCVDMPFASDIYEKMRIIDNDGRIWRLDESFPARWLYEDFENELSKGKLLFIEEQEKCKRFCSDEIKKKDKQIEDYKKLIESVKNKFTKEEVDASLTKEEFYAFKEMLKKCLNLKEKD